MLVNGIPIPMKGVVDGSQVANTPFEHSLFTFVSQWVNGEQSFVQRTSGSTGSPKDIVISRTQMIASAKQSIQALGIKRGTTSLICIHAGYIGGKMMVVRSLMNAMKIVAVEPSSNPFSALGDEDFEFAAMVPLQVHDVVRSPQKRRLERVRVLIIGGGAPDPETIALLQSHQCLCYSTYGMTETISHIALRQLNGELKSECYKVLPGIHIDTDSRGCLIVNWDILDEPLYTNDLVNIRGNDCFVWLGRWDNVINSGGVKIIPEILEAEIQTILANLNLSNRTFISGEPDPKLGMKVILFIEGETGSISHSELQDVFTSRLSVYHRPKEIVICKAFVNTANEKINRIATSQRARGNRSSADD